MLSIDSQRSRHSWLIDISALLGVFLIFYLTGLGSYPLFTPDEGRYSEAALGMVLSGDYITPRVNGVPFLDKPILYYWLQAISIHLFGLTEWALRFFPAMLGITGSLVTYICGRQLFNRRTGLLASVILATSPLYFGGSHYANLDLEVAAFISMTLMCFITAVNDSNKIKPGFLLAAYIFAALAFLTKGMIGIVFPAMIAGCWMLLLGRLRLLTRIHLLKGLLLITAIELPWYLMAQQANPEFLHFFFVTQQVSRFLSSTTFNSQNPAWFYVPVILAGILPWTCFVLQAIKQSCKRVWRDKQKHSAELFLLLWFGLIFLFFSVPHSKLIGYIIPVIPALALLIAHYLSQLWSDHPRVRKLFYACLVFSIILLSALVISAKTLNTNTAKPLVTKLKTIKQPHDEVVHYFKYYYDVPLYLKERVSIVANWDSPDIEKKDNWVRELWYGMAFQDTKKWLIKEDTFWQHWNSDTRVFVFVNNNYFDQFKAGTKHFHEIERHGDIILLSNR